MPNPVAYTSAKQFVGLARETTRGTAMAPTVTIPVDKFDPEDKPTWLDDRGLRGSLTDSPYNRVQGPIHSEADISGQVFFDSIGYLLANILGDVSYAGTYTGSGSTTLSTASTVGATSIQVAASIAASTLIQIDTGAVSEVRTVQTVTGSGPYTLTLDPTLPLFYPHSATTTAVKPIQAPFTSTFSLLNSGDGQPGSLTFTDYQGPTPTTASRAYAGGVLSELNLKGNAESTVITYDGKITAWPSAPAAATPTSTPSGAMPMAAWRSQLGLAGTVATAPVKTIDEWEIDIKREVEVINTAANTPNPYAIWRGRLSVSGKLNFRAAADETPLTYLLNNTQPQWQLISNAGAGATLEGIQADIAKAAWTTSKIDRSKATVGYATEFDALATTTNAGGSGGFSPLSLAITSATAPNSY